MSEIHLKAAELKSYLRTHDIHSILFPLGLNILTRRFEEQYGSIADPILEYVLHLVGCVENANDEPGDYKYVEDLAKRIFALSVKQELNSIESGSNRRITAMKLHRRFRRNTRFPEYISKDVKALFLDTEDQILRRHYGFGVSEAIEFFESFPNRIATNLQNNFSDLESENSRSNTSNIFEIQPKDSLFLPLLSFVPGANRNKNVFPLAESTKLSRPILNLNDRYYVYHPYLLTRQLGRILTNWLKDASTNEEFENWKLRRGSYLEKETVECLKNVFPDASVFQSLYYEFEGKEFENDCCVIYDQSVIAFEQKSGVITPISRIKRNTKKVIGDAFGQSERLLRYVSAVETAEFKNREGFTIATVNGEDFSSFIRANITLDYTGFIGGVQALESLGFIEGWGWTLSLDNLRIITSCLETPAELLFYLKRKRELYKTSFYDNDELETFGCFLENKLDLKNALKESDFVQIEGFAKKIEWSVLSNSPFPKLSTASFIGQLVVKAHGLVVWVCFK